MRASRGRLRFPEAHTVAGVAGKKQEGARSRAEVAKLSSEDECVVRCVLLRAWPIAETLARVQLA